MDENLIRNCKNLEWPHANREMAASRLLRGNMSPRLRHLDGPTSGAPPPPPPSARLCLAVPSERGGQSSCSSQPEAPSKRLRVHKSSAKVCLARKSKPSPISWPPVWSPATITIFLKCDVLEARQTINYIGPACV